MIEWTDCRVAQLCNTLGEILSIPEDFSISNEIRASKTTVTVIVRESCIDGWSSMFGKEDELWKMNENTDWIN